MPGKWLQVDAQALLGAGLFQVQCPSVEDQRIEFAPPQHRRQILLTGEVVSGCRDHWQTLFGDVVYH